MLQPVDKVFYPDSVNFWGIVQFFQKRDRDLLACYDPQVIFCHPAKSVATAISMGLKVAADCITARQPHAQRGSVFRRSTNSE